MESVDLSRLADRRVVIVEDEAMIAMFIEDVLLDHGCAVVGRGRTVEEALAVIERERPQAVTLDGNLEGEMSGPVARRLDELGIPYLVVTGYVERTLADPHLASAPRLEKPFTPDALARAAAAHLC